VSGSGGGRRWAGRLALGGAAIGLTVLVFQHAVLAYLATVNPALALRFDRGHPQALLRLAERTVVDAEDVLRVAADSAAVQASLPSLVRMSLFAAPVELLAMQEVGRPPLADGAPGRRDASADLLEDLAEARRKVDGAIRRDPLNQRALTLRGRIEELLAADPAVGLEQAHPFYALAERLSPRASLAIYRLLVRDVERKDYTSAIRRADTLLRTVSQATAFVVPVLARLAEVPVAAGEIAKLLASAPPWRERFFADVGRHVTDGRTPLMLLLALKDGPTPPKQSEVRSFVHVLASRRDYDLAYSTWLQFLPADDLASMGLLFNGGFTTKVSGFPFDWTITAGAGTLVSFAPVAGEAGQQALQLDFQDGRVDFGGVSQILMLAPGRYGLAGRHRGELVGRRGLRWRMSCLGRPQVLLAETGMHIGPIATWRPFELSFTVPEAGCPHQILQLVLDARSASERIVRGTFWYDDLEVRRIAAPVPER
jgi:hypothetical protein